MKFWKRELDKTKGPSLKVERPKYWGINIYVKIMYVLIYNAGGLNSIYLIVSSVVE